jgi:hypothetical protein
VPLTDERTGAVSREWYRWFYSLYNIVGGGLGVIPVASGGTGLSTIPTNGQLLIGNGTGYSLNTLGVGAGISVTNGTGTITVANTGVLSNIAGSGISVSSATGNVSINNTGVLSFSGGTTGLTPTAATSGVVTLAGTLAIANGGTGASNAANARTNLAVAGTAVSNTFSANQIISVTNNTNAALRITQLGTGNALLVEDSANPDATPVVIDNSGRIISGHTSSIVTLGTNPVFQLNTAGAGSSAIRWSANNSGFSSTIAKSRSATIGTYAVVSSGDQIGALNFLADDGTDFIQAASIQALVDGTPGLNDMPGRLVFSTTADGASTPTERMRINSAGEVLVGGTTNISSAPGTVSIQRADSSAQLNLYRNDTSIIANNLLGEINFLGNDTTSNTPISLAYIEAVASGNHAAGDNPTDLTFGTTADNSETVTERMRIDSSGNVGIGTNSPSTKLQVAGTAIASNLYFGSATSAAGTIGASSTTNGGASIQLFGSTSANPDLTVFSTSAGEKARIDASGNFLVGTTSANPSAPFTGPIVGGSFKTIFTTGSVANAASTTLFTIGLDSAYLVTVQTGNASGLSCTAIVRYVSGGNPASASVIAGDSALFTISVSGTAVRVTNTLGGTVNFQHNSVRIF